MNPGLFSPERHEPVTTDPWDETRARKAIRQIVENTEDQFSPDMLWPTHPLDAKSAAPQYNLYWGACGVIWGLRHLHAQGALELANSYDDCIQSLLVPGRMAMGQDRSTPLPSYLMGDTGIQLLSYACNPMEETAEEIARLIECNVEHPSRELMWGSPGTLLAASFMHAHTQAPKWAQLYNDTAARLWSELEWSAEENCHYWTQDMYGERSNYLDAVHGFVATALCLIQGRHLMRPGEWDAWRQCIANTVRRNADWDGGQVNWRARLSSVRGQKLKLMQYCHGAPGFVVCLGGFPDDSLDDLMLAAGAATWAAGPLRKGSNLCHGTGGNGYAFLKPYQRTGDAMWLERARAFAMHGLAQTYADLASYGRMRYSLWTGDIGFAIYLWACVRGGGGFPTLDVFFD